MQLAGSYSPDAATSASRFRSAPVPHRHGPCQQDLDLHLREAVEHFLATGLHGIGLHLQVIQCRLATAIIKQRIGLLAAQALKQAQLGSMRPSVSSQTSMRSGTQPGHRCCHNRRPGPGSRRSTAGIPACPRGAHVQTALRLRRVRFRLPRGCRRGCAAPSGRHRRQPTGCPTPCPMRASGGSASTRSICGSLTSSARRFSRCAFCAWPAWRRSPCSFRPSSRCPWG